MDSSGVGHDEIGEIFRHYHMYEMIDCEDAYRDTPLSEAAGNITNIPQ